MTKPTIKEYITKVYSTAEQKQLIHANADAHNLSDSEYLCMKGLEQEIQSDKLISTVLSVASQLYCIADHIDDPSARQKLREIGGVLCGLFEDSTQSV